MSLLLNFLKSWSINIVIITIFVTFLEIILPNGTMKRYIRLIIGLLIIIVLINPFINLLSNNINIDKEVFAQIINNNNIRNIYTTEKIKKEQRKQILELYRNKIEKEIKNIISETTNYIVEEVYVDIVEDEEGNDFGQIKNINLLIKRDNHDCKDNSIKVDKVQTINIDINKSNTNTQNLNNANEYSAIKEIIYEYYSIPKENININNYED